MFKDLFGNKNINKVSVNGKIYIYEGNSVVVRNGQVIVDGKVMNDEEAEIVNVIINGNPKNVHCEHGSVTVNGNAGEVRCGGSCEVSGDVDGNISAGGSVRCGSVAGSIRAGGSVMFKG